MTVFWHCRYQFGFQFLSITLFCAGTTTHSWSQEVFAPVVQGTTLPSEVQGRLVEPAIEVKPVEAVPGDAEVSDPGSEDLGKDLADLFGQAMPEGELAEQAVEPNVPNDRVRFSFDGVAWREVIRWLAEEGGLALHVSELPTGSFTYTDPRIFTHAEAIDRINLFLLPEGFTLVRSGQLLSVINLSDQRSMQQLDAMADLVTVEELKDRSRHEVVKCIFPLGGIDAEEAVQELSVMKLMTTPEVLGKTNQLIITDTAAKLRSVQSVLSAFQPELMDNGTVVKSFRLKHVSAEDVLLVARPHLGLATGEMIGIDVSISADVLGENIFVTGMEDKVKLLEGLVTAIDQPEQKDVTEEGEAILRSHSVTGGNVETVYNVLQTLLAGRTNTIRLSMDEDANTVVAFAPETIQREIEQTVSQLQATEAAFEVIPLKSVDPYFVVSLLEEMLDLPDSLDDPEGIDPDAPKIDADPGSMRLFVRAKKPQLDQIKRIVEGLDAVQTLDDGNQLRIIPLKGERAAELLETAVKFWRGENEVIQYPSLGGADQIRTERVVNGSDENDPGRGSQDPPVKAGSDGAGHPVERGNSVEPGTGKPEARLLPGGTQILTSTLQADAPVIRCQVTPRGLLLQSDDPVALDRFEQHLRAIIGPLDSEASPPVVFYLQYSKADDAVRLLADLLDGGETAMERQSGSLVNGFLSSSGTTFGSFVTSRDGLVTLTAGLSLTIIADTRLNRLIAQGSASEIEQVEAYLEIIDKDTSLAEVKTYGQSHVIELVNTKAMEVAAVIREAYTGRVVASKTGSQQGQQGQQGQPRPTQKPETREADSSKSKKPAAPKQAAVRNLEPQMTVAVHEPSNSLVVTAPDQLFEEVQRLVMAIDVRAEQTVEVVAPANGAIFETLLQQVMLGETGTSSGRPSTSSRSSSSSSTTPSPSSKSAKPSGR